MLPSRYRVYKDYKMYKPKSIIMFHIGQKRKKQKERQKGKDTYKKTKRSKKHTVQWNV